MLRKRLTVAACAWVMLAAQAAWCGEIEGERKVAAGKMVRLRSDVAPSKDKDGKPSTAYSWTVEGKDVSGKDVEADLYKHDNCLKFTGSPGTYRVRLVVVDFDKRIFDEATAVVVIGAGPDPGPTPPVPPVPPVPPEPKPDAPLAFQGFAVLIVYESKASTELPAGQQDVIFGKKVRDYLKANCLKDQGNPNGAYRIYDKDIATDGESKAWQDGMKRARAEVPWIVISNGKTGYEGPLPKNADEALALFAKYAVKGGK